MTRKFTFMILAMLFAILGPGAEAWGQTYENVMELDMTTKEAKCGSYNTTTSYGDWKITNGANNNGGWAYFKMGGKSATISTYNPCYIYYSANSGVSSKVDKITVSIAAGSLSKSGMSVNSWGVYVYSDKNMTTQIDYVAGGTITSSAKTFDFYPSAGITWASGYYYKVSWDLANTTSTNGIVCVDKITLYKASTPSHTLTFSATNGSISAMNGETVIESGDDVEEGAELNITATANGWYKFSGWSVSGTGSTLGSTTENPTTFTMGTADATLTATFAACVVTVNSNDEDWGIALYDDESHTISTAAEDGYRISSTEPYTIVPADAATLTPGENGEYTVSGVKDQDVEITINFEAIPTAIYTVTFIAGTNGTCSTTELIEEEAGAGVTLPGCTPNTGYQFVGWATTSDATEADAGVAGETYNPTESITLYAVYNSVYTITWIVNGTPLTEGEQTTSVVEGEGITTLPTTPADISGMKFQGWTATQIATSSATAPTDLFTDAEHAPAITANTTFYAVFAEESEGDVTWNKVSAVANVEVGEYVIINNSFYLPNTTTSSAPSQVAAPTITDNKIANTDVTAVMQWSLSDAGEGKFYVKNSGDDYLYATNDNNGIRVGKTSDKWTFEANNGALAMKESSNSRYCATYKSGSDWRSYTSANHSNYGDGGKLYLYKKTAGAPTYSNYCTTVVTKVLESIELSGDYPTEFWKGETFNHDGITVTAHYENDEDEDVTEKAEFTGYDMATAGEQTVTVTYKTKEAKYDITVKTIANTQETAYTTAQAKELIDAGKDLETAVYVKGTVSKIVTEWSSQYGNITFDVSEDGQTTGNQFRFYRNFNGANETPWASAAECPAVGDDVIGLGKLTKYGSTYEFTEGNYIVSLIRFATLSIDDITVSLGGTITPEITSNVPEDERTITYSVASEDEDVVKVQDGKLVTVAVGGPVEVTATLTAEGYKSAETTFTVEVIKALQSIAVKTAPTTSYKAGDFFNPEGLVITATYSDASTGDIAYEGNEDSFAFEPSLETALTTENTSVTITYAGKETTQEIVVRALYTYDITWMANGIAVTLEPATVVEGNTIGTLPTLTNDNIPTGFEFAGWSSSESSTATIGETYIVNADVTLYAVFSREEGGTPGSGNYEKVTAQLTDWRGDYLIAYSDEVFMDGSLAGGTNGVGKAQTHVSPESALSGNTISAAWGNEHHVTIEAIDDTDLTKGYVIKSHSTTTPYFYQTSNSNGMAGTENKSTAATYPITITLNTENDVRIALGGKATGAVLRYNNTSGSTGEMFRYYKNCGQQPIYLYKKDAGAPGTTHYYTRVFSNETATAAITIAGPTIIPAGSILNMGSFKLSNDNAANLVIEDGGQLIHHNAGVAATVKKSINGYTGDNDNYYLIANPTDNTTVANLTSNKFDLYTFNPAGDGNGNEWINMKNLSMDVENGIGYLYANYTKTTLEFAGNLTPAGSSNIELTYANAGEGFDFPGFNLIGNPFACNAYPTDGNGNFMPFYKTNETGSELTLVKNVEAIAPCEGFFVEAEEDGQTVVITTEESEVESSALSLTVSQNRGSVIDRAIVSFNGSANLHKFMLNPSHTNLSIAKDGETFAAVSSETKGELPVSFKAETTGTYTISVNTENVTAGYIHLIDNMTGTDVDLLATPSYTFIGSPRDNENRFTLKFEVSYGQDGDGDEHFAYQNGSELVINGEGTLQIFDILGRVVISEEVHGQTVNVGGLNTGAYIVRLTGESVKTQKIVVR